MKRINPRVSAVPMLMINKVVELSLLLMTAYSTLNLLRSSVGILRLPRAGGAYRGGYHLGGDPG